jgi:hypothetical protein
LHRIADGFRRRLTSQREVKRSGRSQNYQNADGAVTVPEVLRPYLGATASLKR